MKMTLFRADADNARHPIAMQANGITFAAHGCAGAPLLWVA